MNSDEEVRPYENIMEGYRLVEAYGRLHVEKRITDCVGDTAWIEIDSDRQVLRKVPTTLFRALFEAWKVGPATLEPAQLSKLRKKGAERG